MERTPLPAQFETINPDEAVAIISEVKAELGERLVILGHHYQCDEVIQFADLTGDSLELSRLAAQQQAEFIVFCGVHFMAESADILTAGEQAVLLPDLSAGCSMADMADIDEVEACWDQLRQRLAHKSDKLVPICYVNSTAAIKAFCGRHGGMCCTSSNCKAVFEGVWQNDPEAVILFLPDEHLARNTGWAMGKPLEAMPVWDPAGADGGLDQEMLDQAEIILWKGHCEVHQEFTVQQMEQLRVDMPEIQIMVHPECCFDVCRLADEVGSTSRIIQTVEASAPGSQWALGTEQNLVQRLADRMKPKGVEVRSLATQPPICETMAYIDLPHLAWILDAVDLYGHDPAGEPLPNRVVVGQPTRDEARLALQRMLDVTGAQ